GNRIESGLHELTNHIPRVEAKRLREEIDLRRTEAVDVNRRILLDVPQQIEIPLEGDVRVVPALHQDLYCAQLLCFIDLLANLLVGERPALVVLGTPVERTEATVSDTDVRVVD